jgi:DNA-binding transcriptional ArsR family regulator
MTAQPSTGRPDLDETTRMAKAMAHPLRGKILMHLSNHGTASPADLSRVLEDPIGNVSYHVRMLLDLDCVELVDTRQRRGAVEHFYRATRRAILDDAAWAKLPPAARKGFAVQWFREAFADLSTAIDAGRLEGGPEDVQLNFTKLALDEDGWNELHGMLDDVVARATDLQARAANAPAGERRSGRLIVAQYQAA